MATRAETFKADSQRHPSKKAKRKLVEHDTKKKRAKRSAHAHENKHAKKKAPYALEERSAKGVASRKSTRGGGNRTRNDSKVTRKGELVASSSDARYRRGK